MVCFICALLLIKGYRFVPAGCLDVDVFSGQFITERKIAYHAYFEKENLIVAGYKR